MAQADQFTLGAQALSRLMPLFLCLDAEGRITALGPTLAKLLPDSNPIGQRFDDLFDLKRPARRSDLQGLRAVVGERLHLAFRHDPAITFRGLAMPTEGGGLLVNLSFGIAVTDAVRRHGLTDADFSPTDLTVEMLYLVEAKSAVVGELRDLNLRLQGAKSAAEEQALTDTLTGLRNRRALDIALGELTRHGLAFGLMHIDLDFFKQVNDTLGHAAGDHVLRSVAQTLTLETRSSDTVTRVGGDEFVVILPGMSDTARLGQVARRIIEHLTQPIEFEGHYCRISASVGVTVSTFYPHPQPDRMLSDADDALYASKRAGRGRAQFFTPPPDSLLSA
jgi:diguanylate cyclase (GGDEF)-like protein